jgi:hypothetical protein
LSTLIFQPNAKENTTENTEILGVVYDVHTSAKGYVFSFENTEGESIRCFYYDEPINEAVYVIKGDLSDDGGMFFIKSMYVI